MYTDNSIITQFTGVRSRVGRIRYVSISYALVTQRLPTGRAGRAFVPVRGSGRVAHSRPKTASIIGRRAAREASAGRGEQRLRRRP